MTSSINVLKYLTEEKIKKIDELLVKELTLTRAPALSIGIVQGNELVFTRNYGSINIEENTPATSDSIYMIASVTKSFTALGVLKLVEKKLLSLDDKLNDLLPLKLGFEDDPIRVKHLMSHCSGMPNFTDPLWEKNNEDLFGINVEIPKIPFSTWDDIYRLLNSSNAFITERPGKRFYYNNLAFELLGKIIEEVSGKPFPEFINDEILKPLEMENSGFYDERIANNPDLATPYIIKPGSNPPKLIPISYPERKFISAAGGLFSSVKEMANYMIMHLNNGKFKEKTIIAEELLNSMHQIQFLEEYPNQPFYSFYGEYGRTGYGYGLVIHENFHGHKLIEHSGSYMGASSWMVLLPEEKIGVVFLSNHHPSPRMLAQAVLLELLGKDAYTHHPLLRLRKHHEKLTGTYVSHAKTVSVEVVSRNGGLFLNTKEFGNVEIPLFPANDNPYHEQLDYYSFTEIGGKLPVQFTIDEQDNVWLHYERLKLKKVQ